QGRIGIGGAALQALRDVPPADAPSLDLAEVDAAFDRVAATAGRGSAAARDALLRQLFGLATQAEQDFLARLLFGELRQGALEGVLTDAVARAAGVPAADVRRAAMLAGDLAPVAHAAMTGAPLAQFVLQPFQPVQPMLADSAADVADALAELGEAAFEYKLDGARIQVHKVDDEVRVFTRNLRDVTAAVPEIAAIARAMPARSIVLDGEAIAMRADGRPQPFQVTMKSFGRTLATRTPLTPFFFDVLYLDGAPLVDDPLARRVQLLGEQVTPLHLVPRLVTGDRAAAAAFAARAQAAGHEGVMAKAIAGTYAAGRRGSAWLKVKQARTLDL